MQQRQLFLDLHHFTFLNFGVERNIILRLKNNIDIVSAGKIKSIKSEFNREGIPAKIKCMRQVAKDMNLQIPNFINSIYLRSKNLFFLN